MTTIADARTLVLREVSPKEPIRITCAQAVGRVLAEDVLADVDSPPHRKSLVDGYAVRAVDTKSGDAKLHVIEEVFGPDKTAC